jgi:hypothetical protein
MPFADDSRVALITTKNPLRVIWGIFYWWKRWNLMPVVLVFKCKKIAKVETQNIFY